MPRMHTPRKASPIIYTSHYMEEVEQICSRIAIMDKGKNLAIGTCEQLKNMIRVTEKIHINILDFPCSIMEEIKQLPHVDSCLYEEQELTICYSGGKHNLARTLNLLQEKDVSFGRVYSELPTLNDVFLEITGKELRDKEA